jgi:uncharacterized protein YeaO (DUF488 family)
MYDIEIFTSFVTPYTLDYFIKNNLLPVFILRNIRNSNLIGKYSDSAIHFKEFSPSNELFQTRRDRKIEIEEYKRRYLDEIKHIDLSQKLKHLTNLKKISGAKGIILMSYGSNPKECHRSFLAEYLNNSNLLEKEITEYLWK